jgi:hypothetical protein
MLPRMFDATRGRTVPALCLALLLTAIALGACQWAQLHRGHPVGTDFFVYSIAVQKAWAGQDPYLPLHIGWGFLYPPPALLLLKAVALISPAWLNATYTFMTLSIVAVVAALGLLARQLGWWSACVSLLLLGSAGMIETVYIGQINALVVFCIALFFWAWRRDRHLLACGALAAAISLKITPSVFVVLFLARGKLRWLGPLAACVAVLFLTAEVLIPAAHLTSSFLTSFQWAARQAVVGSLNYSLSFSVPRIVRESYGFTLDWHIIHRIKLLVLAALLGTSYLAYLRRGAALTSALFVTANVCMVIAPNIVWLHHTALWLPALWILLVDSKSGILIAIALAAQLCIQAATCADVFLHIGPAVLVDLAQLMLLAACALCTALRYVR